MANSKQKNLLVTTALPYGNGALHIGHLLEHTQTDVWVRTNKMEGNNVLNFCADDAHGAPIMIKAKEEGQDPEEFTKGVQIEHLKTLKSFGIEHDHYHSTHSVENEQLVNEIYNDLVRADLVYEKEILQLFDDQEKMFLADRYIKGTCPSCGAEDQYGDGCEVCGITYDAIDIKNPISALSGTEPSKKKTNQIFFNLNKCKDFLSGYLDELSIQESVKNKLLEWLGGDLQDWNISRDKPYFGFKIPQHDDKYFYVWVDAPIGYIAATKHYCDENKIDYLNLWGKDSNYEIHHFIGKDIIYFHGLFWPAMLNVSKYKLPSSIHAHGFLSLNGEKMSKSKGTLISADKFAEVYEPDLLRFYFASKLNAKIDDIDLDLKDFVKKINSSLVGKLFNIASRLDGFLSKNSYQTSKNIDHAFLDECSSEYELIRKDLNNNIPVDSQGNLLSPNDCGYAQNVVVPLTSNNFVFGDQAQTESAWRKSSDYHFSLIIAWCLNQPTKIIGLGFDRSRTKRNSANELVYSETNKRIALSDIVWPNTATDTTRSQTAGFVNYIFDYLYGSITTTIQDYKNNIANLQNKLGCKF